MKLVSEHIELMQNLSDLGLNTVAVEISVGEWFFFCYESITTPNPSNHIHDFSVNGASCLNFQFNEFISNPEKASLIVARSISMRKTNFTFSSQNKFIFIN